MSTPFFAGLVPVEFGGGGGRCCLQGRRCPFRLLSIADGGAVNTTDGGGRVRGRIQHRSHRQAHKFSLPESGRGVFTLGLVQYITVPYAKQHDGDGHLGRPCGRIPGQARSPSSMQAHQPGAAPGDPLCRRASASSLVIQRTTLLWALMAPGCDRRAFSSCSFPVCRCTTEVVQLREPVANSPPAVSPVCPLRAAA